MQPAPAANRVYVEQAIRDANAAVIGTLDGNRLRVDTVLNGPVSQREITVDFSGGCTGAPLGQPQLFLLEGGPARWRGNDCSVFPPESARGLVNAPPQTRPGRVAFLLSGRIGNARVVAVDRQGNPVAYGDGEGRAVISPCPGGQHVVELIGPSDPSDTAKGVDIEVRDLRTLAIVDRHERTRFGRAWCMSPDASELLALETEVSVSFPPTTRLVRLRAGEREVVLEGHWESVDVDAAAGIGFALAAVPWEAVSRELAEFDLATGQILRRLSVRGDAGSAALSPDGELIAVHARGRAAPVAGGPGATRAALFLIERGSGRVVAEHELETHELRGVLSWLADDELAFVSTGGGDYMVPSRTFDRDLRERRRFEELSFAAGSVQGGRAVGVVSEATDLVYGTERLGIHVLDLRSGAVQHLVFPGAFAEIRQVVEIPNGPEITDGITAEPVFAVRRIEPAPGEAKNAARDARPIDGDRQWVAIAGASTAVLAAVTVLLLRARRRRARADEGDRAPD